MAKKDDELVDQEPQGPEVFTIIVNGVEKTFTREEILKMAGTYEKSKSYKPYSELSEEEKEARREAGRQRRQKYLDDGMCPQCGGKRPVEPGKKWCEECRIRSKEKGQEYRANLNAAAAFAKQMGWKS